MYKSVGLLVLRLIFVAWMLHGVQKLMDIEGTTKFFSGLGIPMPNAMAWVVSLIETFGSLALLLGLGTRYVAPLMAFVMLVAILTAHLPSALKAGLPFGYLKMELPISYFVISVALALSGPGRYSLDKLLFCKNKCDGKCQGKK
ncbi:MAG: DoxX family protein [Candidatus Micrarchaeota archaeon]